MAVASSRVATLFPLPFDEADVRRLAGAGVYGRADAWQREGHVSDARVSRDLLMGSISGTFHRSDHVQVTAVASKGQPRLSASCTCGRPGTCIHAATLLLHWLRQHDAFRPEFAPTPGGLPLLSGADDRADEDDFSELAEEETPSDPWVSELASLLTRYSLPRLREVARRRGIRGTSRSRAELLETLPAALAAPESVAAALALLSEEERRLLQVLYLLGPELATVGAATVAYRALGGTEQEPAFSGLENLALAAPPSYAEGLAAYTVPRCVAVRLPPLPTLARPAAPPGAAAPGRAPAAGMGLDLFQALLLLITDVASGRTKPATLTPAQVAVVAQLLSGWQAQPADLERLQAGRFQAGRQPLRVVPAPTHLSMTDQERLARVAGRSRGFIVLAWQLCRGLDFIDASGALGADIGMLEPLLAYPKPQRLAMLAATILNGGYPEELRALLGPGAPLELRLFPRYFAGTPLLIAEAQRLRHLVYRSLRLLPPDAWHDFASFLHTVRQWAPCEAKELSFHQEAHGHPTWWIADPSTPNDPLSLEQEEPWRRVYGQLIGDFLAGPLVWLGLVEVTTDQGGVQAFRVLRTVIEGFDQGPPLAPEPPGKLLVRPDGTIVVPAGAGDGASYVLLLHADPWPEATPAGLRFRLTAQGMQTLFGEGTDGPTVLKFLRERSREPLPEVVTGSIEAWSRQYARLRLYDDVTLLELADDYLLTELLATSSLASAVVQTFSPRLVALDPRQAEAVIQELTRRGHPPKVVEGNA